LSSLYDAAKAETIIANCDVLMAFRTSNWDTLQTLSRQCGDKRIKAGDISMTQPLISPTQLGAMETGQALAMINGRTRFITQLPDYTSLFDCQDMAETSIPKTPHNEGYQPFQLADLPNIITSGSMLDKRLQSQYKKLFAEEGL